MQRCVTYSLHTTRTRTLLSSEIGQSYWCNRVQGIVILTNLTLRSNVLTSSGVTTKHSSVRVVHQFSEIVLTARTCVCDWTGICVRVVGR